MASPGTQVMTGANRSNAGTLKINCGFRPRVVIIWTNGNSAHWQDSMADGGMFKRVTAGTGSAVSGGAGVTPLADGFNIGNDADINPSGSVGIQWAAWS